MNISYRWLQELAPKIAETAEALADRLTRTNVPVEDLRWLGAGLEELVVARVTRVSEHPRADRLVICQVDVGAGNPRQVVTGAPNVVEGACYPFVAAGQRLPAGQEIQRVKLRGEYSEGMLCSERELGIGRDAAGIMQLQGEYEPGQRVIEVLERDDYLLELEVTPNRPDLLGHWGVARELAPGGERDLGLPDFPGQRSVDLPVESASEEGSAGGVTVRIEDPQGCPRYMGAIIRGVKVGPSPDWLANRLRAVGQQPLNNVVDATNFVLQELNQPLHAFDLAKLQGSAVVVRRARAGERLRTLDGKERSLDPEMLMIADAQDTTALAGVMGGEGSEVTAETRDVFFECAYFEPQRVRRAARTLDLDTDASYRFQRGMDPEGLPRALRRLVELILAIAGGQLDGHAIDVYARPARRRTVSLRPSRVRHLLGKELSDEVIVECLAPIGFELTHENESAFDVSVPTWRPDVEREVDLIEEVARRHGYDRFPDEMRAFRATAVPADEYVPVAGRLRELMVGLGFLEARTIPFVGAGEGEIRLQNPLSEVEDHLRTDMISGLIHRVEHNFAQGQRDIRLFELGTVFRTAGGPMPEERIHIAAVSTGSRQPAHWSEADADWDIWDLKWLMGELGALAVPGCELCPLEPGDGTNGLDEPMGLVGADGQLLGWGGRLPSERLEGPRWAGPVYAAEVVVLPVHEAPLAYRELPVYPAAERDLAVIVQQRLSAAEVDAVVREAAPQTLESLSVFDVYEGENIPAGTRSIAWRLRFRSPDRTLTDEEVDEAMRRIISALEEKLNVRIRGA